MNKNYNIDDIIRASKLLEIGERASIQQIKSAYRRMMQRWHPDKCTADAKTCSEMAHSITEAYKLLIDFCVNYKIPFNKEQLIKEAHIHDPEMFWKIKFGSDPHWGGSGYA